MRIALAQINPIVGDIDYNKHKVIEYVEKAKEQNADLVVFSEMVMTGYPVRDLIERKELVNNNLSAVNELLKYSEDIGILLGFVDKNLLEGEKPLHNTVALLYKGKIVAKQNKSLLPDYDVFDERRYFEPAHCVHNIEFKGKQIGVSICEDLWVNSPTVCKIYKYDPNKVLATYGADIFINLSASPYSYDKPYLRQEAIRNIAVKYGKPFVYVNQVGGNDDLIFDGKSIVIDKFGNIVASAKNFEEDLVFYDTEKAKGDVHKAYDDGIESIYEALKLGLKDYVHKCGFKKVVLGLSGGIDSALTAAIAVNALGSENVVGLLMPGPYSTQGSIEDALELVENLGIQHHLFPIKKMFEVSLETIQCDSQARLMDIAEENIQARLRGNLIMAMSNRYGYLAITTGNKSEAAVGYSTLYGDMCGGLAVISDLYKTQVYELANFINKTENNVIPLNSIIKPPSAELKPDQLDQDSLPEYEVLDKILKDYIENDLTLEHLYQKYKKELVIDVLKKLDRSEYKRRQAATGLKVSSRAFGSGRRLPIAQRFKWK